MNDGRAVQIGSPADLFERPEHTFVGYFIGSPGMNFLPAAIEGTHAVVDGHRILLGAAYPSLPSGKVQIGIRPDYALLTREGGVPVQVRRIDDLGRRRLAHVTLGSCALIATVPPDMSLDGSEAAVDLRPAHLHVYVDDHRVEGQAP